MLINKYKIIPLGWIGLAKEISQIICLTVSLTSQTMGFCNDPPFDKHLRKTGKFSYGYRNGLYWIIHLKVIILGAQDMSSQTSS